MALRESIEKQGNWLFRWRSYLPLLGIPIIFLALKNSGYFEKIFGDAVMDFWESICIIISFLGLGLRCFTVGFVPRGTSGRNTKSQVAEILNTMGMYSITRNPLYLSNFIIVLGIALFIAVWWLVLIICVVFWFYYERIIFAEEEFLRNKFGNLFLDWADKTPMILPNFKRWRSPDLKFAFKTILRREFSTFFSIVASFFFLEIARNVLTKRKFEVSKSWIMFFVINLIIYYILLFLKKKTKILNVHGR